MRYELRFYQSCATITMHAIATVAEGRATFTIFLCLRH